MNNRIGQDSSPDSNVSQPKWTEEVGLQTVDADGLFRSVTVYIGQPSTALLALLDGGSLTEISGSDYLDCLIQARRQLERDGRLLCCRGARPDVHPSGQLRQFTNGRQAYAHFLDARGEAPETVDVFGPASPEDVVSLDDQRTAIIRAWNTRHPGNQI
ncbi:hypothetical protein AB0E96_24150 [Kitasatospora sp. NPDC036755]|uniref:hypothetical protein n=1 Tax=Kitasatospora sp. NPDC036755 TaxID=3154600 RepID=UPI0033CA8096